jgi:hypothetical protein
MAADGPAMSFSLLQLAMLAMSAMSLKSLCR